MSEETGAEVLFHKSITGDFVVHQDQIKKNITAIRALRNFRMVFYNFCYYFWGHHRCRTETSIFANDFFKISLALPSTL